MRTVAKSVKLATQSTPISTEFGKKDEIKMMSTVVPVLGYTAASAPNVYPTIESGIQMYPGAQPAPAAYPTTTYQQGVNIKTIECISSDDSKLTGTFFSFVFSLMEMFMLFLNQ